MSNMNILRAEKSSENKIKSCGDVQSSLEYCKDESVSALITKSLVKSKRLEIFLSTEYLLTNQIGFMR